MRPVLHGDVSSAARVLLNVTKIARAALCDRMIQEAEAADRHFHQTGRSHLVWGNGSLMGSARKRKLADEPTFSCPEYCACFEMVLHALIAHQVTKTHR
ncbi:MAG: hypothetical protein KUG70_05680 [Rhodobacteraceae bacterium]|nr:hypothetical protein [Paracoccaceae bacterium]